MVPASQSDLKGALRHFLAPDSPKVWEVVFCIAHGSRA
jgi:hypothetical protein